jgi:hypothetical protein
MLKVKNKKSFESVYLTITKEQCLSRYWTETKLNVYLGNLKPKPHPELVWIMQ